MKIFITYSRSSKEPVVSLVKDLEELGHEVWFDHELNGGQAWWDNILSNIRDCQVYIFSLTKEALDSVACRRELDYAKALQKSSLPVLLESGVSIAIMPRYLSNVQYVDYTNPSDKNAIFALLKAVNSLPASPPLPDPLPPPPIVPISYLDNIKDKIDSPTLDKRDQVSIVNELKNKLQDPENRKEDIYGLLKRLKKHDDLFASVSIEIDQILVQETTIIQQRNPAAPPSQMKQQAPRQAAPSYNAPRPTQKPVVVNPAVKTEQKGWNQTLMVILCICSVYFPLGILAVIISFFTGATRKQSITLIIITASAAVLTALISVAMYS